MPPRINVPPLTRGLIAALLSLSLLNGLLRYRGYLSLAAEKGEVVKYGAVLSEPYLIIFPKFSYAYPWVLITATFVEQNLLGLILSAVTIFFGGRYLERAWSSAEFAKFTFFASMIPNLLSFAMYFVLAASLRDQYVFYPRLPSRPDFARDPFAAVVAHVLSMLTLSIHSNPIINGTAALQSALLVSFKQLVPEHTVSLFRNLLRIRVKHFPALHLLFHLASAIFLGTHICFVLALFGFLTSWTYLRFYKLSPSLTDSSTAAAAIKGDASDTFAFAYFFPEPFHTPTARFADLIYDALVACRLCTPFSNDDVAAHNEQASARAEGGLPSIMHPVRSGGGADGRGIGGSRAEAERRRALALKALDQRLQAGGSAGSGGGGGGGGVAMAKTSGGRASVPAATPNVQTPNSRAQSQGETYALEEQPVQKPEEM
ncbi:MAG: hypothetical protein M1821_003610 [Bathelium mastoideum]|nr:MAG: hypothetical protein M1821_003610 [Bathelium mastoideum]KAI9684898.1 MAG: hypothetical protein M1822_005547 [Bathelium mastoideum]